MTPSSRLGSGFERVAPPASVDWYSVDLPGVSALRGRVLPEHPHAHAITATLADPGWPARIPGDRPTILVADGLFAFLTETVIAEIFRTVTDHFSTGEIAFNDYGGIGWLSRAAIEVMPQKMFNDVGSLRGYAGFKDAHHPLTWNPNVTLVEETSLTTAPEVDLFPAWLRICTRLMGRTAAGARKARILRYAF